MDEIMKEHQTIEELEQLLKECHFPAVIRHINDNDLQEKYPWILIEAWLRLRNLEKVQELLSKYEHLIREKSDYYKWNLLKVQSLRQRGAVGEVLSKLSTLLTESEQYQDLTFHFSFLVEQSACLIDQGKYETAIQTLSDLITRLTGGKDKYHLGLALSWRSIAYWQKGMLKLALEEQELAMKMLESHGTVQDQIRSLNVIGSICEVQHAFEKAIEALKKALTLSENIGNQRSTASALNNIGNLYYSQGELNQALDYHLKALNLRSSLSNENDIAISLNNLGNVYSAQGFFEKALECHSKALKIRKIQNNPLRVAMSYQNIGQVLRGKGEAEKAIQHLEVSLELYRQVDNPTYIAWVLSDLVIILSQRRDLKGIQTYLARFPDPKNQTKGIKVIHTLLEGFRSFTEGDVNKARDLWQEAISKKDLPFDYQIEAYKGLLDAEILLARKELTEEKLETIKNLFYTFETVCKENKMTPSLCMIYLLRAKFNEGMLWLEEAEKNLVQCELTAIEKGLPLHQRLASQQLKKLRQIGLEVQHTHSDEKEVSLSSLANYLRDLSMLLSKEETYCVGDEQS